MIEPLKETISVKTCCDCGVTKPRSEFYARRERPDGVKSYCKPCSNLPKRKGPVAGRSGYRRRSAKKKRAVFRSEYQATKSIPCADCGRVYPPYVMEFDHLDPASKEMTISYAMAACHRGRVQQSIRTEIAKCEVVCSNCHRKRTHERDIRRRVATPDLVSTRLNDRRSKARDSEASKAALATASGMIYCYRCKGQKVPEEFSPSLRRKSGARYCRACHGAMTAACADASRGVARHLIRTSKNKPCMDCGEAHPWFVMDFDHRDPSAKTANVSLMINRPRGVILAEIEKCDLVCANCHRKRTHRQRNPLAEVPA